MAVGVAVATWLALWDLGWGQGLAYPRQQSQALFQISQSVRILLQNWGWPLPWRPGPWLLGGLQAVGVMVGVGWAQVVGASGASAGSWASGGPVALGPVPASVVKDAGWGFQWGGLGLSEVAGDLLDEAQGPGQGQGTNF